MLHDLRTEAVGSAMTFYPSPKPYSDGSWKGQEYDRQSKLEMPPRVMYNLNGLRMATPA